MIAPIKRRDFITLIGGAGAAADDAGDGYAVFTTSPKRGRQSA